MATAIKRLGIAAGRGSSSVPQVLVMFILAAVVFMFGILVGSQFFDHESGTDSSRPWAAFTKQKLRLPPGIGGIKKGEGLGQAAVKPPVSEATAQTAATLAGELPRVPAPLVVAEEETPIGKLAMQGPQPYIDFQGRSALGINVSLDSPMVSVGAWIYLDSRDSSASIKMIASNRFGGCAVDDEHRGWSLYVNNWQTADRALVLEWRSSKPGSDGCGRLSSEPGTIEYSTWTHVGFALTSDAQGVEQQALLFLNGELLRASKTSRAATDVQRDGKVRLAIGAAPDNQYYFNGKIAHFFVSNTIVTPKQLIATARLMDLQGLQAMATAAKGKLLALLALSSADMKNPGGCTTSDAFGNHVTDLSCNVGIFEPNVDLPFSFDVSNIDAVVAAPPLARKNPQAFKDGGNEDKTPMSIRRGPISGSLPEDAVADFSSGGNQWIRHMIRVPAASAAGATSDKRALAAGTFSDDVTAEQLAESDSLGRQRAGSVKAAMQFAWKNYRQHAWGADELKPRTGTSQDNWGGLGMTLVDSLDTLWLMGMAAEFEEAKQWVAKSLFFNRQNSISVFEVTIRELGGLLAAYDLSGEKLFLDKAKDLADNLLPAFNTPTGIPRGTVVLGSGQSSNPGWTGGATVLAELGTLQVEFRRLSKALGTDKYSRKVEQVIERLEPMKPALGLYPIYISPENGQATTSQVTFGALGDSFYEYLLKVWVQGGRKESMYRNMYDTAMEGMTSKLLKRSHPSSLMYVAEYDGGNTHDKMDHLVCFVPGMLALGAFTSAGTPGEKNAIRDLINAKSIMYTCWQMYERMATGIAAEFVDFPGGGDLSVSDRAPFYILRPEAAESLFIMHQLTGNPIYREWGWKMFQAIDKYCKLQYGYGAHPDVRDTSRTPDDRMESFFLAETLKYLYLLQSPDHPISLERYVFNTEAHPVRIFSEL